VPHEWRGAGRAASPVDLRSALDRRSSPHRDRDPARTADRRPKLDRPARSRSAVPRRAAPVDGSIAVEPAHRSTGPRVVRTPALVTALQRQAGNAAVTALLGQPTAQRAIGDGHDLSSPRFAGVPILEACFDDQARLGEGASGDAVTRVQQALLDLGGNLGPTGVDGQYGPATAAAVRAFKAKEKLASSSSVTSVRAPCAGSTS
jgi:hypothetical protein